MKNAARRERIIALACLLASALTAPRIGGDPAPKASAPRWTFEAGG